jgi:CheY-like chemotaxis protein
VANFHNELTKYNIPFVVIGDSSSIDFITKTPGGNPDLELRVGMTPNDISGQLTSLIEKNRKKNPPKYPEVTNTSPTPTSNSSAGSASTSDTYDIMAKIDAELHAMEKVGIPNNTSVNPEARQSELPGRHRILVIDDATIVHKTIKGYLDSEYEVATAISGKVALRYLMTKEVSLILLDYEMPEMDGPAVLSKLRANTAFASIPVVFLTGINDVEKIKNALALKPQGYLLKPVDRNALIAKLHEIIK